MLSPGQILQNRYEIEVMLGKGGFGAVYRARDQRLKRLVAIKETLHLEPHILRLFEREAEVLASLEHPALPSVTDHFSEGETYYTVMSFIPGQDLGEYLSQQPERRLSEQQTLATLLPVLDALEYLHTRIPPVIHRDVKPGNIRLTPEGRVYLVDFGLAKLFDAQPTTMVSMVALTPSFSPPEQYYQQADTRSDMYALGATFYVLLTGIQPIPAHERMSGKELVPLRQHNPDCSPAIEAIIMRMMAMAPEQRYQTIADLRPELRPLLVQGSTDAAHPTPPGIAAGIPTLASTPLPLSVSPPPSVPASAPQSVPGGTSPAAPAPQPALTTLLLNRLNPEAVTSQAKATWARLHQAPAVQRVAARLPLPASLHPLRSQIVVGGAAVALVMLLLIGWLVSIAGSASVVALSEPTRARVQQATIKIEAEGSFTYPTDAWRSWIGQGSGVIIDPSGIAITNNHVVAGAGTLQVFVGGEERPRLARVLGTSECLDLALVDIEGNGFPTLPWYEGPLQPGLAVFAAGFPSGGPITVTNGVVTQAAASGETAWASLDTVIEHNATIQPGSSGGPLVTADGAIVGINYRSRPNGQRSSLSYAIARDDIRAILAQLQDGERVLSIGVNGEAVRGDPVSGIWVYSVESGSLADRARIRPGDLVTHLEGVPTGDDGALTKYCRVLRSHAPSDVIALRVVRAATGETFEGQLNGRELEAINDPTLARNPVVITDPAPALTPTAPVAAEQPTAPVAAIPPIDTASDDPTAIATLTPADIATASRVSPIGQLPAAELAARQQAVQNQLAEAEQRLNETFDTRATRTRWLRDNNTANLRHRLIHEYYELTLKKPQVGLVDPWNHRRLGDTYIVAMDIAFAQPTLFSGAGIVYDMLNNRNFSQFIVYSDGTWEVRTVAEDEIVSSRSGTFSTTALRKTEVNNLRVVRQPDKVEFWLNNIPVGTAPADENIPARYYIGITGTSGDDAPVTVLIDNLFVWE